MHFDAMFPVTVAAVAVVMDLRTAKVDNGWLVFSLCVGFAARCIQRDGMGFLTMGMGILTPVLWLGLLFWFHMLGAGDIKLFCVLGSVMGPGSIGKCILCAMFLGAGISLAILISSGCFSQRFLYFIQYVQEFAVSGKRKPYSGMDMQSPESFHFTVPVFLSVVLYAGGVY